MPDLRIDDLVVEYTTGGDYKVRPIDGLTLDIPAGSLAILLGPSGCGKTTLLSCLGGILTPTSGSIRFGDVDVGHLSGSSLTEYRRHTVGIVFQAFNLVASLTAVENVMVPMRAAGVGRKESKERAEALLGQVDLGHRVHYLPGGMSGGQQQRVAVARALALDPPLILADEPTAHLDFVQVEEILRLVRALATGERVVVVSTHDSRMIPLADHVVEMVPILKVEDRPPERIALVGGDVLFNQGDTGDVAYIIDEGEVEILREHADGTQELRVVLGPGDYFGEMAPFFGIPRTAMARARGDTVVTAYTQRVFRHKVGAERLSGSLGAAAGT